jgi:hypothetical protein
MLATIAVVSFAAWSNFFQFHYGSPIHRHEFFHYYLGSKYLPELAYNRLYRCTVVANAEGIDLPAPSVIRNLETNRSESTEIFKTDPDLCKQHFSPERWGSFKRDLAWFNIHLRPNEFSKMLNDHGFNGTPVWAVSGYLLSSISQATSSQLYTIGLLDLLLMSVTWFVCFRTFGLIPTCIAIIFWGANPISSFAWTGNGFLRADWLVSALLGVCALKERRFTLGGALLAFSGLVRVFPLALLGGVGLNLIFRCIRGRREPGAFMPLWRLGIGAGCTTVLCIGVSLALFGTSVWSDFAFNTKKHAVTYSTNLLGLPVLMAWSNSSWSRDLEELGSDDSLKPWVEEKRALFTERKPLYVAIVALTMLLLIRAASKTEPWQAAIVGSVAISLISLSNYDYYFLMLYALLFSTTPVAPVSLLLLTSLTWPLLDFSPMMDQRFFIVACLTQVFLLFNTWELGSRTIAATPGSPTQSC